jgi:hypothetical protein
MEANGALATLPGDPLDVLDSWYTALGILKDLRGRVTVLEDEVVRHTTDFHEVGAVTKGLRYDLSVIRDRWGDVEAVLSHFANMIHLTEDLCRRADDFDQKIGVLRAKVREIPAAEDTEFLKGAVRRLGEGQADNTAAVDALASRLGRLEHAVETEGLGAVLRRLEAIDEALEGLKAGEGRPARGPHRKVAKLPEREEDLDGEAFLTVRRWVDLEGELPEAVRREGNTLSMGRRLALAYRECGVEFDPRSMPGVRSNVSEGAYPVADLRAYAMWLTSMPMRKSFDGWLGYFQNHCLPAWTERALRLKGVTA